MGPFFRKVLCSLVFYAPFGTSKLIHGSIKLQQYIQAAPCELVPIIIYKIVFRTNTLIP